MRKTTTVVAVVALGVLALVACTPGVAPKGASPLPLAIRQTPIANPSADVRRLIKQLTTPWEFTVKNGRSAPSFDATALPDLAAVMRDCPGARFPTYTAGRKLAGIVLKRPDFPQSFPTRQLWLLYQDNLQIFEADYTGGPPAGPNWRRAFGSETTTVAGVRAEAFVGRGLPNHPALAVVRWEVGGQSYLVSGPHITLAQVVRIARSMSR